MPERKIAHCHKQIRAVARTAAAENYDELMSSSNLVYSLWKKRWPELTGEALRRQWVNLQWGRYIPMARATLALLLREPIDDKVKEKIVEVLALDASLIRGRANPATVAGQVLERK